MRVMNITIKMRTCEQILEATPKQQLYGHPASHLPNHLRWTGHAGNSWRRKNKLISNILWTPTHGYTCVGQLARTDIHQLCVDTGYSLADLWWVIGTDGERGSGNFMLLTRLNDYDVISWTSPCFDCYIHKISATFSSNPKINKLTKKHKCSGWRYRQNGIRLMASKNGF